jgi:hypothetical protein
VTSRSHVAASTMPVWGNPRAAWKAITADCVSGVKVPS